jgi:hypothetical protein
MSQYRRLLITLGVVALLLVSFGAAAAKGNDKPQSPNPHRPARLTWTPTRLYQAVTAGQTMRITASFVSSADIKEATLIIPGGLGRVLKADPAKLTNITAGTTTTITFTVTVPANGAHTQGGVVLIRAGQRVLAQPLPVLLIVAKGNDGGAAKPPKVSPRTRKMVE